MKKRIGRPPKGATALGRKRTLRFEVPDDDLIDAALALEGQEFSEFARPLVVAGARKAIEKARKR